MFDEQVWQSVLPRVRKILEGGGKGFLAVKMLGDRLFHSSDMDQYLDADAPDRSQTIRSALRQLGIAGFVRMPESSGLVNYLEVGRLQDTFLS